MQFNTIVKQRLMPIFLKNNLVVVEEFDNYLKAKSPSVIIIISHDPRDKSNSLYIGKNEKDISPVDESTLRELLDEDIRLDNLPKEVFIDNIALIFLGSGQRLAEGNVDALNRLERIV